MKNQNRLLLFVTITVALLTVAALSSARAQSPVKLGDLVSGQSLQVGDKLFTNWNVHVAGYPMDAHDINVIPITDVHGNYGFRLQSGFFAPSGQFSDVLLTYRVTVLDPTKLISDIHLAFNGATYGTGALALVVEQGIAPGGFIRQAMVYTPDQLSDVVFFEDAPQSFINVSKDIFLFGGVDPQGFAIISFIDQTFSQTERGGPGGGESVPEPSTLALFGLGAGTLALVAWNRKRRDAAE
jgi:hypothetical protein